jgi:hypothetical protein
MMGGQVKPLKGTHMDEELKTRLLANLRGQKETVGDPGTPEVDDAIRELDWLIGEVEEIEAE